MRNLFIIIILITTSQLFGQSRQLDFAKEYLSAHLKQFNLTERDIQEFRISSAYFDE